VNRKKHMYDSIQYNVIPVKDFTFKESHHY
jgi:hypothetical protein